MKEWYTVYNKDTALFLGLQCFNPCGASSGNSWLQSAHSVTLASDVYIK